MATKVRLVRIKEEDKPVDMRHKLVSRIVITPRRYANESLTAITCQGVMYIRDDMASRMQEAYGRESVGQDMSRRLMMRFSDALLDDEEDEVARKIAERKMFGPEAARGTPSGADGKAASDDDDDFGDLDVEYEDADDDPGDDMEDDDADKGEGALRKKANKPQPKYFKLFVPAHHFPFAAPFFRYKCVLNGEPKFPPHFSDLKVVRITRCRHAYTWAAFSRTVVQFAPFIVHDSTAKQQATGRVGSVRQSVSKLSDIVRIQSRVFRNTAAHIFHNAFRTAEFYQLHPLIPDDEKDTISDAKCKEIMTDLAANAHLHEYIFPVFRSPFDADWIDDNLALFPSINRLVHRYFMRKRLRRKRKGEYANIDGSDSESDSDDRAGGDNEPLPKENPLSDDITGANSTWRYLMRKSLDGTYVWDIRDWPCDYTTNKFCASILVEKKVLVEIDTGIYTSLAAMEMVAEILMFCHEYKDHIILGTGRGIHMDEVIVDSYVRDNATYPTDPKKRYIMCPTRSHALLASQCCGYTPINLANLDKVREQIRTAVLPVAELVVVDSAHLYGLHTMHFLITKIDECLRTRQRPFKLVITGAPVHVLGKTHRDKWPIFMDIMDRLDLPNVSILPAITGNDLRETLGTKPGFPLDAAGDAKMKVVLYDDSAAPAYASLPRSEAWKWSATSAAAAAAAAASVITRIRASVRAKGAEPLILFDYSTTMRAVTAQAALEPSFLHNGAPVVGADGGQAVLTQMYELRTDRSTAVLRDGDTSGVHPLFVMYRFEGDAYSARRSLLYEPISPLRPATLRTCRYTPSKYVIFVTGTHNFRQDDLLAAAYYATLRLFVVAPQTAGDAFSITSHKPKMNMLDLLA